MITDNIKERHIYCVLENAVHAKIAVSKSLLSKIVQIVVMCIE